MQILANIIPYFISQVENFSRRERISFAYLSIENVLGFSKSDCILKNDFKINKKDIKSLINIVNQLKKNVPIQYIFEETIFYNLKFKLNKSTLIPRNETEELVKWVLQYKFNSLFDIGTGSGCIPISIAKNSNSIISALDISLDALEIAKINAMYHNVKVDFICDDIFSYIPKRKYDIIISNPPYVLKSEKVFMSKHVLDHEPHSALFVDDSNPIIFYERIIKLSSDYLNDNGMLFFEINEKYSGDIIKILSKYNFVDIELKKDINDRDRMIKAVMK
ncbi:MAG: peptide chain release factor N(5)-glutamine methyltransferase [Flavobacteriales bacterium]|mgnify:FL=1|jgi:release factor glutamine methyltransferase|nr:peptide chain release factor N(5)-glutamine methyltransferase [Flavobacteriales bacterium]